MSEENNDNLINECRRIEEDCLYTAEAHYIDAACAGRVSFWVKLIPAVAAAVSGAALLGGAPGWIAWATDGGNLVIKASARGNPATGSCIEVAADTDTYCCQGHCK